MALSAVAKGKKRAIEETTAGNSPTLPPPAAPVLKRSKSRAETTGCPICGEQIPLRLLAKHADLESGRIETIIRQIGSEEPIYDEWEDGPGPSMRSRRSAIKARKSIAPHINGLDSLTEVSKTLQMIKRHRKQRHTRLKEMLKEEDERPSGRDAWSRGIVGGQIVCPVCSETVRGDQGVLEAHIDTCVANESRRAEETRQRELAERRVVEDVWESLSDEDTGGQYAGNLRGAGFHTRHHQEQDVDEEVDIDGDDHATYGEPQFNEGDILPIEESHPEPNVDAEIDVENDDVDDEKTLRELVAEGKVVKLQTSEDLDIRTIGSVEDQSLSQIHSKIETARKRGDKSALIHSLESKIKHLESTQGASSASLLCRICLDPYDEPTISTGCWHTCCRECWLRCLGSTKLCPICKRITVAGDLRRIYL